MRLFDREFTEKERKIIDRLESDYNLIQRDGYNVLGVFLQGSQNYGLDYDGSDIDTKAIIIPSFEDFVLNRKPISTTLILPSNEHIDVKDIRLMHECFRKQNINFIEILFTKYNIINADYYDIYKPMFANRERIAHYNNYASVNCIAGMVYEKHKAMEHPYPTLKGKIEKYGYDNKQLHHILRCREFLLKYINGVKYENCLQSNMPEYLIRVKSEYCYSLTEARHLSNKVENEVKAIKQDYMDNNPLVIDTEVDDIMNNVLIEVLKHSFKKEIGE